MLSANPVENCPRHFTMIHSPKKSNLESINTDLQTHPVGVINPSNVRTGNVHPKHAIEQRDQYTFIVYS